jgi:hypothetical protein
MKQVKLFAFVQAMTFFDALTAVAAAARRPSISYGAFSPLASSDSTNAFCTDAFTAAGMAGTGDAPNALKTTGIALVRKAKLKGGVLTNQLITNNLISARQFSLA